MLTRSGQRRLVRAFVMETISRCSIHLLQGNDAFLQQSYPRGLVEYDRLTGAIELLIDTEVAGYLPHRVEALGNLVNLSFGRYMPWWGPIRRLCHRGGVHWGHAMHQAVWDHHQCPAVQQQDPRKGGPHDEWQGLYGGRSHGCRTAKDMPRLQGMSKVQLPGPAAHREGDLGVQDDRERGQVQQLERLLRHGLCLGGRSCQWIWISSLRESGSWGNARRCWPADKIAQATSLITTATGSGRPSTTKRRSRRFAQWEMLGSGGTWHLTGTKNPADRPSRRVGEHDGGARVPRVQLYVWEPDGSRATQ